ncbi:hypothetical protein [Umezawaea sp. Da 62-37]|uniref:hypothetical protein n=1 Tax=Umezawaea sp. Da 62-37 TaxID=3075927 RepID=UPI0028F70C6D|nr:hypothetical protein [Umezawaea sp. Da 62-37]WNV90144.1 hypothetical protein RM788_18150 [Umezawaea sp. Da 62-37]
MNGLRAAMRDSTRDVEARTGFAADVLRGARRRKARRRKSVVLAVVAVFGITGVGTGLLRDRPADPRLAETTRGDLAGDGTRLADATTAWRYAADAGWRQDRGIAELRGEPHVYWMGSTQAGPAAVVMQEGLSGDGWRTLVGLVATDPADGRTKVLGSTNPADPPTAPQAFQFGRGDNTFLVVDPPATAYVSTAPDQASDGRISRRWAPVPTVDGVAVWTNTTGGDAAAVRLVVDTGQPPARVAADRLLTTHPADDYLADGVRARPNGTADGGVMPWPDTSPTTRLRVGATAGTPPSPDVDVLRVLRDAEMTDVGPSAYLSTWRVYGNSPDGRGFLVCEYQDSGYRATTFTLLFDRDGGLERVVREPETSPSPLRTGVRLPDGRGWVVAQPGSTLRYRSTGDWQDTGQPAALVPDDTAQVEVTLPSEGRPSVVDLPR